MGLHLSQRLEMRQRRPEKCPDCGSRKIHKNGSYTAKSDKLREALKLARDVEMTIQRFVCADCGKHLKTEVAGAEI